MARLCVAWIASLTKVGHVSKCIYFVLPKEKEKEKEKNPTHTHKACGHTWMEISLEFLLT